MTLASLSRFGYLVRIRKNLAIALLVGRVVVGALGACGDNASPCYYTETDDATNDTTAEMTNLTVSADPEHVCGAFDGGHHDDLLGIVDTDTYRVDIETAGPLLVELVGGDGVDQLHDIAVQFLTTAAQPAIAAVGHYYPALADHGAYVVTLAAGSYDMQVTLYDAGDLVGSIDYRVRLAPMPPCDTLATPNYSEQSDATNGAIAVDYTNASQSFTMIAGDTPEASGVSVDAGHSYMIAGNAGTTAGTDQYLDRDTYAFATNENTNELAIRLDWQGMASDLDFIVFEAQSVTPVVASNTTSDMAGELAVFGVKPSTPYWLWIGAFAGGTTAATAYTATVCGTHFFY